MRASRHWDERRVMSMTEVEHRFGESVKRDVSKLRSPSEAGRRWIEDRRMAIASVGPWRDTIFLRRKGETYPAVMIKARQQGVTYSYSLQQR